MQHFTAAHSDHEKCSLLSVSSPHNTDLSIKSGRYRITKGHPAQLIMIRGPGNRTNTSKAQSPAHLKKILTVSPSSPSWRWGVSTHSTYQEFIDLEELGFFSALVLLLMQSATHRSYLTFITVTVSNIVTCPCCGIQVFIWGQWFFSVGFRVHF